MKNKKKISREFLIRVKCNDQPAFKIAQAADLHPSTLSQILHGKTPLKDDDPRVLRIGQVVGLSKEEVFA